MKKLVVFLAMILLISCSTTKEQRVEKRKQKKCELATYKWGCDFSFPRDTVKIIKEVKILKDTTITIKIPGETIYDSIPVPVPVEISTKSRIVETQYAKAEAWIESGKLKMIVTQKDIEVQRTISNAIREYQLNNTNTITVEKPKPYPVITNKMNLFQKIFFWIGLILTVFKTVKFLYRNNVIPKVIGFFKR